jgi:pilus assembly protein CpaB
VLGVGALIVARVWLPQPVAHGSVAKPVVDASTVPVVVASAAIPYGGKVDASHLVVVRLPASAVPPGAYSDPSQIAKLQGGVPVALTPIAAREPVLPGKLSTGGARPIVSAGITEGMRAYTISVNDVSGVGGHILPGDRVDVIVTRQPPIPKAIKEACDDCKLERADVVLQNIKIIGIDLNIDPTTTQSAQAHTATLEVSVQDAQKLSVAGQIGTMSLALRRVGQSDITPVRTVEVSDVKSSAPRAPGPAPIDERLAGRSRAPATTSGPRQILIRTRSITVVHGETATQVEVPRYGAGA